MTKTLFPNASSSPIQSSRSRRRPCCSPRPRRRRSSPSSCRRGPHGRLRRRLLLLPSALRLSRLRRLHPFSPSAADAAIVTFRRTMSASTRGGGALSPQAAAALDEGIGLVFARWTALQMAVENQWGGRDSRSKADQLAASILSWFSNSKGPYYFDDLEDMMYERISESFNADFEDGSVGEVAEQLLIMHEECVQSNYSSIEKLRNTRVQGNAVSQSRQMVIDGDDDSSDDDDDEPSMMDDEAARPEEMAVDEPKPSKPVPDADGWTVVPPKRGRGKN